MSGVHDDQTNCVKWEREFTSQYGGDTRGVGGWEKPTMRDLNPAGWGGGSIGPEPLRLLEVS